MKIGSFDLDQRVMVVAEIGNNHEGSFSLAQDLIGLAAEAGADAVKFQTFEPEHYVHADDKARLERLRGFRLSMAQFELLAKQAAEAGILFFSTPFDIGSAVALNKIQQVFKISSGDNNFWPLIETIASFGKPIILSSGLADIPLLQRAQSLIQGIWSGRDIDPGLAILHCVSSYPVPAGQANLRAIATLRERLGITVGYSDHTLGIDACLLAIALGARIIEKHFTISKTHSDFRDHQLSSDPAEMKLLVQKIRDSESMLGTGDKRLQPTEIDMVPAVRRSIAAGRDLSAGTILRWEDLTWVRPGAGLPVGDEHRLLGHRLKTAKPLGSLIRLDDLDTP